MWITALIWSYVENKENKLWDWQKLIYIAVWSYFRVVCICFENMQFLMYEFSVLFSKELHVLLALVGTFYAVAPLLQ